MKTKDTIKTLIALLFLSALLINSSYAQPVFTGDVPADFTASNVFTRTDPGNDVGFPSPPYSASMVPGWEVLSANFQYDWSTDIMYVGVDCKSICGDADGDGDPGGTSPLLQALLGSDVADIAEGEWVAIAIDTDNDMVWNVGGDFEAIAGVSMNNDISSFRTYESTWHLGMGTNLSYSFGPALPNSTQLYQNPSAAAPDLEFSIADFSQLPGFSFIPGEAFTFQFMLHLGSMRDDGIGEDLITGMYMEQDFGDAPDPLYPTLFTSAGASHLILPGYYLGNSVDADIDGQPNGAVTGDDNDGSDDEDGVQFITPLVQGNIASIDVTASGPGFLTAWIDFNGDGDWDDPGEHILIDAIVNAGINNLSFAVPAGANTNIISVGRFRFSSVTGLTYTGQAPSGEVEDYLIDILIPVELSSFSASSFDGQVQLRWKTHSETNNLGFHVYRSKSEEDGYSRVNSELIPGAGNSEVLTEYEFGDSGVETGEFYYYRLADVSMAGQVKMSHSVQVQVISPERYSLAQNFPNPFNPETSINFKLKSDGHVSLAIYNMMGQKIATIADAFYSAGSHQVNWTGIEDNGRMAPTGAYFYQIIANDYKQTRKMILMK